MKVFFNMYRILLSPIFILLFNVQCRFCETCSHYTERQIREHGIIMGSWYGLRRIVSCNPFFNPADKEIMKENH